MTAPIDPWSFFDKIYCISIDTRIDRREEAKKQFSSVGLLDRVEFVLVQKHPENREEGIFQSHMQCLEEGLAAGADHILIFEDDVLLRNFRPQSLLDAADFLKTTPTWKAFFLGAICSKMIKTEEPAVVQLQYRCLAHGYCLNRPFAEQIAAEPWNNIPYDVLLQKKCNNFYALSPMIAFQSKASSDNQTIFLDTLRRFFGGLPFIQRSNEIFQRHKILIVSLHLLVIMMFAFLGTKPWIQ